MANNPVSLGLAFHALAAPVECKFVQFSQRPCGGFGTLMREGEFPAARRVLPHQVRA
jgi:hypothetical protein